MDSGEARTRASLRDFFEIGRAVYCVCGRLTETAARRKDSGVRGAEKPRKIWELNVEKGEPREFRRADVRFFARFSA